MLFIRSLRKLFVLVTLAAAGLLPAAAFAGRSCEARAPGLTETRDALALASRMVETLDASGARIAIVGRIGSDQSAHGIRYTHVGFAQRDHPAGRWTITHVLNICGASSAEMFDEGMGNFFLDEMFAFETRYVIPSAAVQDRLIATLGGPLKRRLFEREYSVIAYPFAPRYQNSNGWPLEILAAALAAPGEISNRAQAQQWLRQNGFVPSQIRITPGERAGARLFAANVRFGDHPDEAWQQWKYQVVSGDSVLNFASRIDTGARFATLTPGFSPLPVAPALAAVTAVARPPAPVPAAAAPASLAAPAALASNPMPLHLQPASAPPPAFTAPAAPVTAAGAPAQTRATLLAATNNLVVSYACREQGYLRQCQQLSADECGRRVSDALYICFAPVSDQELVAPEPHPMAAIEKVGYCAVERVDAALSTANKRIATVSGQACGDLHAYR